MAPLILEGETLGDRHRHYNTLLKEALANYKSNELEKINYYDNDIDNFLKIDIACSKRNIEYILEVLKGEDLLYVSRALKRCAWLVTEPQHAHVINPHHLHRHLFPHMTTKAIKMLMLHIRKHLKDETRVEEFYAYKRDISPAAAFKWLPNCSSDFKLKVVENCKYNDIPLHIFKRMYKKSPEFLVTYIQRAPERKEYPWQVGRLLQSSYPEVYLDLLGYFDPWSGDVDASGATITRKMLNKCPDKLVKGFGHYFIRIDISTFVKFLNKKKEIERFLLREGEKHRLWCKLEYLKPFLDMMPRENATKILKTIFEICDNDNKMDLLDVYYAIKEDHIQPYLWYQFAPFDDAKKGLQKLISAESSADARHSMLVVLLACARSDPQYIQAVLKHYRDKHINEPLKYKLKYVECVLSQVEAHTFDAKTWNLLNDIFRSMEVYANSDNDNKVQVCIETIIIYNVLHDEDVPEIIENKFKFNTLKMSKSKLDLTSRDKIFTYLFDYLIKKLQQHDLKTETEFNEVRKLVEHLWDILKDWDNEQRYHKTVLDKIKELLDVKMQNSSWSLDMSTLYKKLGRWRRQLFSASLSMCVSEQTCLNVLKHEPRLLEHHNVELHKLRTAGTAPRRLLSKLRIYWPSTIAKEWTDAYFARMDNITEHKGVVQGLFGLLPSHKLIDFIKQHAPTDAKIQWSEAIENEISLRKHIAKYLYRTRPSLSTDVVLWYAKGEYLQHAQYSLNATYNNLKAVNIREHIQKLIVSPVSIQKQGIRLAFKKLETMELIILSDKAWRATRNCSIREVLFTSNFKLLCHYKESNSDLIDYLWHLLSTFIARLTEYDNKAIFNTLGKINEVPHTVRADFLMKSFTFLKSLPERADCETIMKELIKHAPALMEHLNSDFVENVLLDSLYEKIMKRKDEYLHAAVAYLLCSKDEFVQNEKFNNIVAPIFERAIPIWVEGKDESVKHGIIELLKNICSNFPKYVFEKNMVLPISIFTMINNFFVRKLSTQKDYVLLTQWKLTVAYMGVLEHHMRISNTVNTWHTIKGKSCERFADICFKQLKQDIDNYFPSIYMIFATACQNLFYYLRIEDASVLYIVEGILNKDLVQSYLLAVLLLPKECYNNYKKDQIQTMILSHPSLEVRMLYHRFLK